MRSIRLGGRPRPIALTFLDCDGVIFDSNPFKHLAFARALDEYPEEAVERLLRMHSVEGGISRYVKMRRFFEELHPIDDPEPAIRRALERFGEVSKAAYGELTPIPDALAFAAEMGGPESVFVVSGADGDELREVFSMHGIIDRFAEVLGSPTEKQDHLLRVLAERGVPPERALLVGDGKGDFDCARELGVPFVFLAERSDWEDGPSTVAPEKDCWVARSWEELSSWL